MKIKKIEIQNYRLLKDFFIDIEDELSLVIGKNNTGKTSLLSAMDKFINSSSSGFAFDDFNISFKEELQSIVESEEAVTEEAFKLLGITLRIHIEYNDEDDLSNISKLMMDLDPENKTVLLVFEYCLTLDKLESLRQDFDNFQSEQATKKTKKGFYDFLKENHSDYFHLVKKTVDINDELNFIDLDKNKISLKDVINFKFIKANRDVSNKEPEKSLSQLSSKIYKKIEDEQDQRPEIEKFKEILCDTDASLNGVYREIFDHIIEKVKKFGGVKEDDTIIKIASTLQHKQLLEGNTTVMYEYGAHDLPEYYNGLGYMNLISLIFEIELIVNEFAGGKSEKPADINLLFIEEPEAHTHPQMQYVFIKNIKSLLKDGIKAQDGEHRELQYIVSTHSSHIVAESNFDDIKYLKRENSAVIAKNLRDLELEYAENGEDDNYRFLKQYLTLHRAELFFADKAIFIEGDTERILLPAMMKQIDQIIPENPLLSQHISIIEVGNYSQIFEKFIDFLGLTSLIITDIDYGKIEGTPPKRIKCRLEDALITTNASLKYFYSSDEINDFKDKSIQDMVLKKTEVNEGEEITKKWVKSPDGHLLCAYQTTEASSDGTMYYARSFEDAFFHLNRQFIIDNKEGFKSLKNIEYFDDDEKDSFELAKYCVSKKPALAIEILLNSTTEQDGTQFSNWKTPDYIKQALLWLKTD
jgi:predicted ATP-dependent endonuclease of OLD family